MTTSTSKKKKIPKLKSVYGANWRRGKDFFKWREKYYFNPTEANRVVKFFERRLVHIEGELRGKPFKLETWQKKILRTLFGWLHRSDGSRKFRTLYLEVPRKNGKSALASGIGIYLLYGDREPGARVVSAAADKDQAAIVFDVSKQMVQLSPQLNNRLKTFKRSIVYYQTASNYRVISSEAKTKHGNNLHGIVFDEVHAQSDRELYDVLHTSTGARRQPLEVLITTAGYDKNSICWELHEQAVRVLEGDSTDETLLAVIYAAGVDEDWRNPEVWHNANPNLGISKKLIYMQGECERAKNTPGYENTFKRLDLNIWTEQDSRWLPIDKWDACQSAFSKEDLSGMRCYGGMDLANTQDLAALVLVFPIEGGRVRVLPFFWVPKEGADKRSKVDHVPYNDWIRQGFIKATEGNSIDYSVIRADTRELAEYFNIEEIQFDRWNATQITQELDADGLLMIPMTQGIPTMTAPSKELERLVSDGKLEHTGNPVLRWMAKNVAVVQNGEGEIKPSKKKSPEKIDGIVALIMALDRVSRNSESNSVYEDRGLLTL